MERTFLFCKEALNNLIGDLEVFFNIENYTLATYAVVHLKHLLRKYTQKKKQQSYLKKKVCVFQLGKSSLVFLQHLHFLPQYIADYETITILTTN